MIHVFILLSSNVNAQNTGAGMDAETAGPSHLKLWINLFSGIYQVLFIGQMGNLKYLNTDRHPVKYLVKMKEVSITHALIFKSIPHKLFI